MKIWTKSSPNHENGLQIAHFCEWCGSLVLKISRNSQHENFDEIIAHSRRNFHVESFSRSLIHESHIIHRGELSEDHFHEWAMISSKHSSREFLEIYNTREPHRSQKWAIWRAFSWVDDDFVQIFMSRFFIRSIVQKSNTHHRSELPGDHFSWVGDDFGNGLQIAHLCEWCGSHVLKISRNSRHENFDEIIAHSWKMVSR